MKTRILLIVLLCFLLLGCSGKNISAPETEEPTSGLPTPVTDPLSSLVNNMTTEELVGQLFLVHYPGQEAALAAIEQYHIGNFILFGANTKNNTPEGLTAELANLQTNTPIPLLIAVDEEGGTVTRISGYGQYRNEPFPAPRQLYQEGGLELVLETEREKSQLLLSLGINVNLAPVCDITTDSRAFMYSRSLGASPEETGEYVAAMVNLAASEGIGSVLKHFPGYGNNVDTHIGTAVDGRTLAELEERDLVPFRAGIEAGAKAIMVSHTIINAIDPELPASLSPKVLDYLRDDMGFDGVIITDDLTMDAIADVYGSGEAAVLAVIAGADLLCCSDYELQYQAVLQAVQDGRISTAQLMKSVMRIVQWKDSLGLIEK